MKWAIELLYMTSTAMTALLLYKNDWVLPCSMWSKLVLVLPVVVFLLDQLIVLLV